MSTTLKALQKIERERGLSGEPKQHTDSHPLRSLHPAHAGTPSTRRSLRKLSVWAAFPLLIGMAFGMVSGYRWIVPKSGAGAQSGAAEPVAAPLRTQDHTPEQDPRPEHQKPAASPIDQMAVQTALEPPFPAQDSSVNRLDAMGEPRASAPGPERVQEIRPYTGDRFKVQAIAWGPEPGQCMAVINNRVVRIGDVINEWAVVRIDLEAVIVREGRAHWQVMLGR